MSAVSDREELSIARLEALAGHWHVEGDVHKSVYGPAARFYDNSGNAPEYEIALEDRSVRISGDAQRAVYEFAGGDALKIRWDWRDVGRDL